MSNWQSIVGLTAIILRKQKPTYIQYERYHAFQIQFTFTYPPVSEYIRNFLYFYVGVFGQNVHQDFVALYL